MEGTKTEDASGGTYRSTHYWAKLPKGRSYLPRRGPFFFKWWKEQVFMCSRAWHRWFSVKLCLPPAPTPAVTSERVCLLLTQSECYSIERFADYLPMPMKSSHFFFLKSGYLFFKGYLTQKHSQNRQKVEPLRLNWTLQRYLKTSFHDHNDEKRPQRDYVTCPRLHNKLVLKQK